MFTKGVPSTFANLKHLYVDPAKKAVLAELVHDYLQSQSTDSSSKDRGEAAALYYLAQHYNYHLSRDLDQAMTYVEKAIEKDSKSVDFHMTKARIQKHGGDLGLASETMNYARTLDLRDRYINSKAAKYQLRNNENEVALKTVGLFTRADTVGGPLADLLDMQCVWYLTEDGEAYARQGNTGMALKRFHTVGNIFDVWQEDQFDFHSFSLRKGQIRAYIEMIRWEDHVRDHPFYSRAALDAIGIYLAMADKPVTNGVNGVSGEDAEDTLARKKAAKKARKEQQRLEQEAAEKQAKADPNRGTQSGSDAKKVDDDPLGLKLAATTDPLGEAMKFLEPLLQACPKSIEAQLAGFEVYMRRSKWARFWGAGARGTEEERRMKLTVEDAGKYVLALRCLKASLAMGSELPRVHEQAARFWAMMEEMTDLPAEVVEVLKAEFTEMKKSSSLAEYINGFETRHKDSPRHVLAAQTARRRVGQEVTGSRKGPVDLLEWAGLTVDDGVEMLAMLRDWRSPDVEAFKKAAQAKWPQMTRLG